MRIDAKLIDRSMDRIVERAEHTQEAAVGALRPSLFGLDDQAVGADVAPANIGYPYFAYFQAKGLTVGLGDPEAGCQPEKTRV
jgi:hypothetical protein